jgi:cellulose synthase/poly-beta-1,6-N-acetylglucosamine synthase-like glycosyltransferase
MSKASIVAAEVRYSSFNAAAVASDEDSFLRFENRLKASESKCMGLVMGVEGSCYLIRKSVMPEVPSEALVDDFFITMHALTDGHKVVWEQKAAVYEEVSLSEKEEFRRKVRISRGNFQNLQWFGTSSLRKFFPLGFAFISHKVFRWFTPVFLLTGFVFLALHLLLVEKRATELLVLIILIGSTFVAPIKSFVLIRSLRHWILMNIALLQGLVLHIQNRGENVWEPTKRNQ